VLRASALAAGIDPAFTVLDETEAGQLADGAFEAALEAGAGEPGAVDLIAGYRVARLRRAIVAVHDELRSRGQSVPALPPLPAVRPGELDRARQALAAAHARAATELAAIRGGNGSVADARTRLERCAAVLAAPDPWLGDIDAARLRNGSASVLGEATGAGYRDALEGFRAACGRREAVRAHGLLERLLRDYGARYAELKRERSALDFEDLELLTRDLLTTHRELRARYGERFEQIMVDELQDTNAVQLELIELISRGNLFTVGDAQQSIYAFRHADVELFERRGETLAEVGARATLHTNFRSRPEILRVLNATFEPLLGSHFRPLAPGRDVSPAPDPRVEALIADKGADWNPDGLGAPWRLAEARVLSARIAELLANGAAARDIVVLTRATTDLRVYERALEARGIPTYVIGGRGYWAHPQVVDLVGYLRALANPRDEEALYTVLASPLVGISVDALVVLAAAGRAGDRDPWWVIREPEGRLDELRAEDLSKLTAFAQWFAGERAAAGRSGIEQCIDRAVGLTGYDLSVLAMPGGQRRLANVRKLMRLARAHEASAGSELRGFLEVVEGRSREGGPSGSRESEAPVEGEALDAVRLMTIHRAKGLEFEIVCVADLGRGPRWRADLMRVGRDGRFGVRLSQPGTGRRESALHYKALGDEQQQAEAREERRLFYVAMTRARERLVVSGAAKLESWASSGGPIAWLGPALLGDIDAAIEQGSGVTELGVAFEFVREDDRHAQFVPIYAAQTAPVESGDLLPAPEPPPAAQPAPPVSALSYSSLGEYKRCGYRFYAERVLGLPAVEVPAQRETPTQALDPAARGVLVHDLLERLDFRRPAKPTAAMISAAAQRAGLASALGDADAAEAAGLVERFAATELCARLGRATQVAREERFAFLLGAALVVGALDVLAREPGGRSLVVDYKTDRLEGADPREVVDRAYATQRLVYAMAALRAGAVEVEVAHVFLDGPHAPVTATFSRTDAPELESRLSALVDGVMRREFAVTDAPHRAVCHGCPAEGGLCSWPLGMTRRDAPDRLF
jgi:ATP-dependent exoDNAse (exonuclease V) beta subunit